MIFNSDTSKDIRLEPSRIVVWLSMLGCLMLNLLPYPDSWFLFKPDFVALMLATWALRTRSEVSFVMALTFGVLMDVAYITTLGQHAFAYCLLLGMVYFLRKPYSIANRFHKSIFVFIALIGFTFGNLSVSVIFDDSSIQIISFVPALVGALIWLLLPVLTDLSGKRIRADG